MTTRTQFLIGYCALLACGYLAVGRFSVWLALGLFFLQAAGDYDRWWCRLPMNVAAMASRIQAGMKAPAAPALTKQQEALARFQRAMPILPVEVLATN